MNMDHFMNVNNFFKHLSELFHLNKTADSETQDKIAYDCVILWKGLLNEEKDMALGKGNNFKKFTSRWHGKDPVTMVEFLNKLEDISKKMQQEVISEEK